MDEKGLRRRTRKILPPIIDNPICLLHHQLDELDINVIDHLNASSFALQERAPSLVVDILWGEEEVLWLTE